MNITFALWLLEWSAAKHLSTEDTLEIADRGRPAPIAYTAASGGCGTARGNRMKVWAGKTSRRLRDIEATVYEHSTTSLNRSRARERVHVGTPRLHERL